MAYDKELYDQIQKMPLGELIHCMIHNYERHVDGGSYMQCTEYVWAVHRLDELGLKLDEHFAPKGEIQEL